MIAAPAKMTQGAAAPLTSVAPITTTSAPVRTNLGHQRVRRVRARRAPLRRAGLPAGAAGRPSAPGTGGTGRSLSRRRDRAVISPVQRDGSRQWIFAPLPQLPLCHGFPAGPCPSLPQHGNAPVCRSDAERVQVTWRFPSGTGATQPCGMNPRPADPCSCSSACHDGVEVGSTRPSRLAGLEPPTSSLSVEFRLLSDEDSRGQ
jgi:hypothetical protein